MRQIFTFIFLVLIISCRNNQKLPTNSQDSIQFKNPVSNQQPETEVDRKTNQVSNRHSYPHILDTTGLSKYINDPNIDTLVLSYCNKRLNITDNNKTIEFLEMISQKNDKFFPLYFRVFNNIIENSDGAVSELMGPYCLDFVINYPNDVLQHFKNNSYDLYIYSMFLGAEFYFKSRRTSNIKYDFNEFKKYINTKIDSTNIDLKSITQMFYVKIDSFMLEMD